eukprot:CAMPEP_0198363170 /NCGR_PEP_ID=MMETSP1450-20131203/148808_1 /TAXON_ID=753684 ORGANISM="Madagascaria erythrocladiodes, Strain CCMP3234" /NCGR_SAMPLE_ID=MMETSP1450 /ASSEMBLY_ACC=CAM_ASM_001115 /LENGTH=83 /DNA_ID=CAMNT_0044070473 /DNA_START=130 /DNA_END=378 /DNA_ORIENTATION=-
MPVYVSVGENGRGDTGCRLEHDSCEFLELLSRRHGADSCFPESEFSRDSIATEVPEDEEHMRAMASATATASSSAKATATATA